MQVTRFYNPVGSDSYLPWHLMGKKKVDENSKGMCKIRGGLSPEQRSEVTDKIMEAQTPDPKTHDNKNSNDWVVCALKILEDSEFIPQGTADIWRRMIGKTPEQLQQELGRAWKDLRKESNPTFPWNALRHLHLCFCIMGILRWLADGIPTLVLAVDVRRKLWQYLFRKKTTEWMSWPRPKKLYLSAFKYGRRACAVQ